MGVGAGPKNGGSSKSRRGSPFDVPKLGKIPLGRNFIDEKIARIDRDRRGSSA
jgi:hypothetical protein